MKKIPVWKNILLIFSLIATIIIATLAWFYTDPRGMVDELVVHVGKASYVQISSDKGENWTEDLEVDVGINKNFKEISGDGTTFFAPVYEVRENAQGTLGYEIVSFEKLRDTTKYYEQVFDFKSDTDQYIFLGPESSVAAVSENGTSHINGAIRVAFFELDENNNETLTCIWAPNSLIEYSGDSNTFTENGHVEPKYYYQKSVWPVDVSSLESGNSNVALIKTADHTSGNCAGCGYAPQYKFMWSCGKNMPQNAPSLLKIEVPAGEEAGYKRMKIRVWLEGSDRECVSQISNQKFTLDFQFTAQEANNG